VSVPVAVSDLHSVVAERGLSAYLLTVSDDGSPHAVHVSLRWDGDALVAVAGRRTVANAGARPSVSLLFPVRTDGDFSLIVDATASILPSDAGGGVRITPTRAVLHRPAATPDPSSACGADCVPIRTGTTPRG
jgi:hypothetical protein